MNENKKPLKFIFSYLLFIVFMVSLTAYLYVFINEIKTPYTTEQLIWAISMLIILCIGYFVNIQIMFSE